MASSVDNIVTRRRAVRLQLANDVIVKFLVREVECGIGLSVDCVDVGIMFDQFLDHGCVPQVRGLAEHGSGDIRGYMGMVVVGIMVVVMVVMLEGKREHK